MGPPFDRPDILGILFMDPPPLWKIPEEIL